MTCSAGPSLLPPKENTNTIIDGVMKEKKCLLYVEGWWTYEYCYLKHVSQYHEVGKMLSLFNE